MPAFGFVADDLTGAADVLAQAHRYGLDARARRSTPRPHALPTTPTSSGSPAPPGPWPATAFDDRSAPDSPPSRASTPRCCSTRSARPSTPPRPSAASAAASSCCTSTSPSTAPSPSHPPNRSSAATPRSATTSASTHGQVHRLDRHPVMSQHPSTPMAEADLRQVLAAQLTDRAGAGGTAPARLRRRHLRRRWKELRQGESEPRSSSTPSTDDHLDAGRPRPPRAERARRGPARRRRVRRNHGRAGPHRRPASPPRRRRQQRRPVPSLAVSRVGLKHHRRPDRRRRRPRLGRRAHPRDRCSVTTPGRVVAAARRRRAVRQGRDVVAHTTRGPDDPRLPAAPDADNVGATHRRPRRTHGAGRTHPRHRRLRWRHLQPRPDGHGRARASRIATSSSPPDPICTRRRRRRPSPDAGCCSRAARSARPSLLRASPARPRPR